MSKSVYVVGGVGAVGCLMLSFMMQHLLKVKTEQARSPVAIELEQACSEHLAGPIDATTLVIDGERTLLVRLAAKPGVESVQLARIAGDLVWRRAYKWPGLPERLRVEVRSAHQTQPDVVVDSRPPGLDRLRAGRAPKAAPGTSSGASRTASPPK